MRVEKISDKKELIADVTRIHLETFTGFFLTFMGRGFLEVMYKSYTKHTDSDIIAAFDENDRIMGFLAYSNDMSGLYKYMIKTRLVPFMWYSLLAFFRKPKIFIKLVSAFLKPGESKREEEYVEISSIGVSPEFKNRGVGSALLEYMKKNIDFGKYSYINLETDAVDNEAANNFYKKNGFVLARTYQTQEKRKMNEYRWSVER